MRPALVVLIWLVVAPRPGAAQAPAGDSSWIRRDDTVRVWSPAIKVKGARGIVTRADRDTVAFVAPAGWRKLPREYVAGVPSIERIDVLDGRSRSGVRVLQKMGLGAVLGAAGGALIGYGLGVFAYESIEDADRKTSKDRREAGAFGAAVIGYGAGVIGMVAGGIDGLRAEERWRRVR